MHSNKDINVATEFKILLLNLCLVRAVVLGALQHLRAPYLRMLFTKYEMPVRVNDMNIHGPVMWHLFLNSLYNLVIFFC